MPGGVVGRTWTARHGCMFPATGSLASGPHRLVRTFESLVSGRDARALDAKQPKGDSTVRRMEEYHNGVTELVENQVMRYTSFPKVAPYGPEQASEPHGECVVISVAPLAGRSLSDALSEYTIYGRWGSCERVEFWQSGDCDDIVAGGSSLG